MTLDNRTKTALLHLLIIMTRDQSTKGFCSVTRVFISCLVAQVTLNAFNCFWASDEVFPPAVAPCQARLMSSSRGCCRLESCSTDFGGQLIYTKVKHSIRSASYFCSCFIFCLRRKLNDRACSLEISNSPNRKSVFYYYFKKFMNIWWNSRGDVFWNH